MRRPSTPLAVALFDRLSRLAYAFERVVVAQAKVSALNAILTGV
jgi:hypothetical protein